MAIGGETLELAHEASSSIEVQRDAKGVYRWGVKRYYEPGEEGAALEEIKRVDEQLRKTYGGGSD